MTGLTRYQLTSVGLALLLVFSGCNGPVDSGTDTPQVSLSNPHLELTEKGPVIAFQYDIQSYSTVLLEAPNGDIVAEKELSPNQTSANLRIKHPSGGNYTVVLKRDGETSVKRSVSFSGPNVEIKRISANWVNNRVDRVRIEVSNTGDMPARLDSISYEVGGQDRAYSLGSTWLAANSSQVFKIDTPELREITINEPGEYTADIIVRTGGQGILTGEFTTRIEAAELKIINSSQTWDGNSLEEVTVTVRNVGDIPARTNAYIFLNGEKLTWGNEQLIKPGDRATFTISPTGSIYISKSGQRTALNLTVASDKASTSQKLTHSGADVGITSMQAIWDGATLSKVTFSATNTGGFESRFTANVSVDGSVVETMELSLTPNSSATFSIPSEQSGGIAFIASGGEHRVTLSVEGPNVNVSRTMTKSFEGPDGRLKDIRPTFLDNYDSNSSELSSVTFSTANRGDAALLYSTIEVEIDGKVTTKKLDYARIVKPGETRSEYVYPEVSVPSGNHKVTVRILRDGEVVASKTTTVSVD